jgi:hypothetical protein
MVIVSFMNGMFKHRIVMRYLISTFIILLVMFFTLNSVTANTPLFKSALSDFNVLNSVFKVLNYVNYTVTYSVDLFIPANSRVELRVAVPQTFLHIKLQVYLILLIQYRVFWLMSMVMRLQ